MPRERKKSLVERERRMKKEGGRMWGDFSRSKELFVFPLPFVRPGLRVCQHTYEPNKRQG